MTLARGSVVFLTLVASTSRAQPIQDIAVSTPDAERRASRPAEQPPFALPPGVQVEPDLVYARYGQRVLKLVLYRPGTGSGPFPGIVFIHGGGWSRGTRDAFRRQAAHLAGRGYVGATIEYRLSGEATFPAAVHDAKTAVRWMRAHAKQYRIDPRRIAAVGGSAGGHLASMLGTTAGVRDLEGDGGNSELSSAVQAVVGFNPALDLTAKFAGSATRASHAFLGGTQDEKAALYRHASPVAHAGKASAPHLLLHGSADVTVPYQQSLDMKKKLEAARVRVELFTADGAAHGFFNAPPYYQPTLERMERFLDQVLR